MSDDREFEPHITNKLKRRRMTKVKPALRAQLGDEQEDLKEILEAQDDNGLAVSEQMKKDIDEIDGDDEADDEIRRTA